MWFADGNTWRAAKATSRCPSAPLRYNLCKLCCLALTAVGYVSRYNLPSNNRLSEPPQPVGAGAEFEPNQAAGETAGALFVTSIVITTYLKRGTIGPS